ncbi:MAG: InlB B-repeat-containing protein [Clostridia bacterium]|nr:InlB B-repeat-containing protein [Clostridia bacterium]
MNRNKKILIVSILIILATTLVLMGACFDFSAPLGKINLDFDSEIVIENSIYAYTGEAIKPSVTVKHRDEVVDAKNYTLTYSDNVNVGKASVKAEGVGDYTGSVSATFDIGYQYTFNVNGADNVDGDTTQIVSSKDDIVPPTVEKAGYDFLYWTIDSQQIDFDDVDNLPSGGEFVASYVAKAFFITYHLEVNTDDGIKVATNHSDNKSKYTVENYFALKEATLVGSGKEFAGWYTDSEHKNRITSLEGYAQNLNLYAKFVDYTAKTIEFLVPNGADAIEKEKFMPEEPIEYLNSQYAQPREIDGVTKQLVWYADSNYTTRYFFREMPNADIAVYAQWEEVLRAGFLDKVDEFKSNNVSIDSFDELVAYIDYVCFNNIVSRVQNKVPIDVDFVKITYVTERSAIGSEIEKALIATTFPRMAPITYEFQGGTQYGSFRIALVKDVSDGEATKSATAKEDFLQQLGNIFSLQSTGSADD